MAAIHSDEFKRDAVRIALTSGLTRRQVASDLGVGLSTLGKWVRAVSEEAKVAVAIRRPPQGCIHHTDRGSQHCAHDCQKMLRRQGFKVSMSGKGNCYDNSAVESFFKSLKAELVWRRNWQTRREVEIALFEDINGFYNPRREHSALGWKSPVAFAQRAA